VVAAQDAAGAGHSASARRPSVHNPAIDAQIKQYSKSQGISAALVQVDENSVDANQFRELEAQLIELKLSWALVCLHCILFFLKPCETTFGAHIALPDVLLLQQVNAENDTLRKSCRDLRRELEQANLCAHRVFRCFVFDA
jgi:hypothetical protein